MVGREKSWEASRFLKSRDSGFWEASGSSNLAEASYSTRLVPYTISLKTPLGLAASSELPLQRMCLYAGICNNLRHTRSFFPRELKPATWASVSFLFPEANGFPLLDLYPRHVETTEPGRLPEARFSRLPSETQCILNYLIYCQSFLHICMVDFL